MEHMLYSAQITVKICRQKLNTSEEDLWQLAYKFMQIETNIKAKQSTETKICYLF